MGTGLSLRELLFGRRISQDNPKIQPTKQEWGLRDALLKCSSLTEAEVEAYIAYEESAESVDVPLDYELEHPDAPVACWYVDGIAQVKTLQRHTVQIEPGILEKVRRVLPLLYLPSQDENKS